MSVFKSLVPIFILLTGSIYGYQKYELLPTSLIGGITFLPHLLAIMVLGLSIRFNRNSVFFYVVLVVIANAVLRLNWAVDDLSYGLLSAFLPLLLLLLTLLPERGIFSVKSIPAYALLLLSGVFSIWIVNAAPPWAIQLLLSDWVPAQYFDWTPLPQTVLIISITTFFYLLILCILRPSPHMSAGFGVLFILIVLMHFGDQVRSLNVFSSAALLMCMYAIMQESWRMAYLDELTGLPARRALREKFQKIGGLYTVAMLDVDFFKKFNDNYGHDTGDAVLRMIAAKMIKAPGGGLCYRYGGEEFCILFTGKNWKESRPYLEALRESISDTPFVINRASRRKIDNTAKPRKIESVTVTASIGVADSREQASSPWDVLKLADKALYRAKGKGRNCLSD